MEVLKWFAVVPLMVILFVAGCWFLQWILNTVGDFFSPPGSGNDPPE